MSTSLITGANRGIGLEYVRQLLLRDGQVFAACRQPAAANELHALQQRHADKLTILRLDVRNDDEIAKAASQVGKEVQSLDILINNAGIHPSNERMGQFKAENMLAGLHTNSVAPVLMVQAFIELLKKGARPKIINISSGMGSISGAGNSSHSYRASKAALNMYSRVLANELRSAGVIVVAMHPGWVKTDMGGSGANLQVDRSVSAQLEVIDNLGTKDSGRYLAWDGSEIDW